jgi:hypothetical protein
MESGSHPPAHDPKLERLANVLMGVGLLVGAGLLFLRFRYGIRTLGGLPLYIGIWVFFLAGSAVRSLAQGARRRAWALAAFASAIVIAGFLVERYSPE